MSRKTKKALRKYLKAHPMSDEAKTMLHRMVKRSELGRGSKGIEWYAQNAPVAFINWQQLIREGVIR